jgi:[protein-PII] uridylyltransferase
MHTYGVLGAYLPNFEAIIGLMQFDLFHAYTVDEHILFTVRNLRQFFVPEHRHELPHCSDVAPHIQKPELLYLAGLFHDIAKGRQGDHSDLGAHEAIEFCQHHGISSYDAQVIAWLVNHHLVMSTTAQRQDISDPDVVRRFAEFVGDSARLDYLYMLTVADIRATNPELWNEWRDALLWRLYKATQAMLRRGIESDASTDEQARECQREAREQLFKEGLSSTQVEDLWDTLNDDYFVRSSPDDVIWQTRQVLDHDPAAGTLVAVRTERGNTAVFIYEEDKNYLFAAATTLFERLGLTVLDARVFTSEDGMSFDTYIVREADGEPITERSRELEVRQTLVKRLKEPEKAIYPVNRVPRRRLKSFPIPPTVMFQTDEPNNRTVMEVITADRPGLLSRIGWALAGSAANVKNAKIATYGERAEDIFFLSNAAGEPLTPDEQAAVQEKILKALQPSPSKSGTKSAA